MDFKVNREILGTNEVIFDGNQEQSIELDYILPDYFPDIFKLIKCQVEPRVVSSNVSGDRINYEMTVAIRILYSSEQSKAVHSVEQKMNYSKTLDMGKACEAPVVSLRPKIDYVNCRAVNQRRIDMRGAVSTKVKISSEQKQQVLCDAFGMNVQLKKTPVSFAANRLTSSKRVNVTEEIDLGYSKPGVIGIIRSEAVVISVDKKVITNKLIVKGDAQVNFLYSCQKDGADSLEAMQFTLPFSQIVDMDGLDDRFDTSVDITPISCDLMPRSNSDGENKLLDCEVFLLIECSAVRSGTLDVVTDAYSTVYPCDYNVQNVRIDKPARPFMDSCLLRNTLEMKDGEIGCVYDAWSRVSNVSARATDKRRIVVMGNAAFAVLAKNEMGMPVLIENETPFEHSIDIENLTSESVIEVKACVVSCSYNLASTCAVEVKAELRITGCVHETGSVKILSDISFDESRLKSRDGNYALKLYFADEGEDIWEIAKKYSTSVNAIMEENELENETLSQRGMILIPIIG